MSYKATAVKTDTKSSIKQNNERPPIWWALYLKGNAMIETQNLILKKAVFCDWKSLYENVWSREETARYMLWDVTPSEEAAKARMERTIAWQKTHHAWIVYHKKTDKAIGFAGLMEVEAGVWEDTGVALGPEYVGRGLGKQILRALMDYVFVTQKGRKLICTCRKENVPSRSVILACGLVYTHSELRVDPRTGEKYELEFFESAADHRARSSQKATALAAATFKESTP